MDIFLVIYVLAMMVCFFLLGAAIGGAARSFKAYFFGMKTNEYYAFEGASSREQTLVENSAVAGAVLGAGAVSADHLNADREVFVEPEDQPISADEWQESSQESEQEPIGLEEDIHRADAGTVMLDDEAVAAPLDDRTVDSQDTQIDAAISRGAAVEDETADAGLDIEEAPPAFNEPTAAEETPLVEEVQTIEDLPESGHEPDVIVESKAIGDEVVSPVIGEGEEIVQDLAGDASDNQQPPMEEAVFEEAPDETAAVDMEQVDETPVQEMSVEEETVVEPLVVEESDGETGPDEERAVADIEAELEERNDHNGNHENRRLFGPEERQQRDANWRERYGGDRKILPPSQRGENGDDYQSEQDQYDDVSAGVEDAVPAELGQSDEAGLTELVEMEETALSVEEDAGDETDAGGAVLQDVMPAEEMGEQDEGDAIAPSPDAELQDESVVEDAATEVVVDDGEFGDDAAVVAPVLGGAVLAGADEEDSGVLAPVVDSDNLQQINFISTGLEKKLNLLGVYKLSQIANWEADDIVHINEQLELKGRIEEEDWVGQAADALASKGEGVVETETDVGAGGGEAERGGLVSGLLSTLSELDKISDMSEHEKTMLSNNGITNLSQIANWSGRDMSWAAELLGFDDVVRISTWVSAAQGLLEGNEAAASETMVETADKADSDVAGEGVSLPAAASDDDLKRVRGIDAETETRLKELGITSYAQIAGFEQADMDRINDVLGTAGRVERQYWVVQAKVLVDGGETDFSKLYDGSF